MVLYLTLLLSAEEWGEVAAENPVKASYVFAYILGKQKDNQKCATDFVKKKGLKLVTFPFTASRSMRQAFFGNIHSYGGPDSGCRVSDYGLIPCGCFLDCVSEAVCGSSTKCGWGERIDEFPVVFAV